MHKQLYAAKRTILFLANKKYRFQEKLQVWKRGPAPVQSPVIQKEVQKEKQVQEINPSSRPLNVG